MISGSISAPYIVPLRADQTQQFLIDTNTLIEIGTASSEADIYYTLDGTKPDAFITLTTRRSTLQYRKPFYIPREIANAGKVAVKAIAVSRNGIRESAVVTKVFDIKIVPSDHAQSDEYENRYLYELQQERQELMRRIQVNHEQNTVPHPRPNLPPQANGSHYANVGTPKPTNVLQCAHCFAPKLNDLYTGFCTSCGRPWQTLTQHQPNRYSVLVCAKCQSTLPLSSNRCPVCETAEPSEPLPQRSKVSNQSTVICPHCKSANPIHLRACYICESPLLPSSTPKMRASVSVPVLSDTVMTCSKCLRVNNSDARFCDWCGVFPEKVLGPIQCTKCRTTNDPSAKFCSSCGCVLDARVRNSLSGSTSSVVAGTLTRSAVSPAWQQANAAPNPYHQPTWLVRNDAATQTSGIPFPSAKEVDQLITQNKQLQANQDLKDRQPILTAVSPGKGYWKQQLDHVCAHLRAYTNNEPEFRALLGEPRIGKMIHATIQESDHQIVVQTIFRKPENLSKPAFAPSHEHEHYTTMPDRISPSSSVSNSDDEYPREKTHRRKHRKRPQSANDLTADSPKYTLIKLLERKATHKKLSHREDLFDEVRRLLKEKNADANTRNKDDYTPIQLAVRNGHHECIETLIVDGHARLDKRGPGGTTALHEACLLGADGVEALRMLIEHGGDVNWLNDRKESVVDLANKHSPELLKVIAFTRGHHMVDQQVKSHYDTDARSRSRDGSRASAKT